MRRPNFLSKRTSEEHMAYGFRVVSTRDTSRVNVYTSRTETLINRQSSRQHAPEEMSNFWGCFCLPEISPELLLYGGRVVDSGDWVSLMVSRRRQPFCEVQEPKPVKAHLNLSSCKGQGLMARTLGTSSCAKVILTRGMFQDLIPSMNRSPTLRARLMWLVRWQCKGLGRGSTIQLVDQTFEDIPSPTAVTKPCFSNSLPCSMLLHAQEGLVPTLQSKKEVFLNYLSFSILESNESGEFHICQVCLPRRAWL